MKVQSQNFRKSEMPGRPNAQRSHARSISAVTLLSMALLFRLSDEKPIAVPGVEAAVVLEFAGGIRRESATGASESAWFSVSATAKEFW